MTRHLIRYLPLATIEIRMITEATGAGAEGPGMEPLRVSVEAVGWRGQEGLVGQLCGSRDKVAVIT